jgi:hypothetical protein
VPFKHVYIVAFASHVLGTQVMFTFAAFTNSPWRLLKQHVRKGYIQRNDTVPFRDCCFLFAALLFQGALNFHHPGHAIRRSRGIVILSPGVAASSRHHLEPNHIIFGY